MELNFNQKFQSRIEISKQIGGDTQKGIAKSSVTNTILLFVNKDGIYKDYFYPKGTYEYCMYTGIGPKGHQDSIENKMYDLNMEVLTHRINNRHLLVFEKRNTDYYFVGEYQLIETHQNIQTDEEDVPRRVFVFHLKRISENFSY